jgi:hypothetical protein
MKKLISLTTIILIVVQAFAQTTIKTTSFSKIKVKSTAVLILKFDSFEGITYEGKGPDEKSLVSKDTLIISDDFDKPVTVHFKNIDEMMIVGTGIIRGNEKIKEQKLALEIKGPGKMELIVETNSLSAAITGPGKMTLSGIADESNFAIPGAGKIDAQELKVNNCNASLVGTGLIRVDVTDVLNATISGSGIIYYKTLPKHINKNISGTGSIKSMDKASD